MYNVSRPDEGTNNDFLDSLTQALLPNIKKSPDIEEKIAGLVNNILTGELSQDSVKERGEKYHGLSSLTILVDRLFKDIQSTKTVDARETLTHMMDSIALFGHANWKLNMKRKEIIKPDLNPPYTRLCKEEIKPTTKLFGDDLSKHVQKCPK